MKRLPSLPVECALKVIAGRWKLLILYHVIDGPRRLSELQRAIPSITQKVLIRQLREMEAHGLVTREVFPVVPPRVEYSESALGKSLAPIAEALCDWGRKHAAEIDALIPSDEAA
jgi:DNA-binding HxlR family transcriptional regulator